MAAHTSGRMWRRWPAGSCGLATSSPPPQRTWAPSTWRRRRRRWRRLTGRPFACCRWGGEDGCLTLSAFLNFSSSQSFDFTHLIFKLVHSCTLCLSICHRVTSCLNTTTQLSTPWDEPATGGCGGCGGCARSDGCGGCSGCSGGPRDCWGAWSMGACGCSDPRQVLFAPSNPTQH